MALRENVPDPPVRAAAQRLAGAFAAGLVAAALLGAWLMTGSVAVLGAFAFVGVGVTTTFVGRAPGPRAAALWGLARAGLGGAAAVLVAVAATQRFVAPLATEEPAIGAFALLAAIAVASFAAIATRADRARASADLGVLLVALAGFALGAHGPSPLFDAAAGVAIAIWLLLTAWDEGRAAALALATAPLDPEVRARIIAAAQDDSRVRAARIIADDDIVVAAIEVDPAIPLTEAHAIAAEALVRVRAAAPGRPTIVLPAPSRQGAPSGG
jgi:divalent metal cation (Fe/Co/Zn/Cd) transporter